MSAHQATRIVRLAGPAGFLLWLACGYFSFVLVTADELPVTGSLTWWIILSGTVLVSVVGGLIAAAITRSAAKQLVADLVDRA